MDSQQRRELRTALLRAHRGRPEVRAILQRAAERPAPSAAHEPRSFDAVPLLTNPDALL